jgi:hypothetical protein
MKIRHFSSLQLHNARRVKVDTDDIIKRLATPGADVCVVGGDFFPDLVNSVRELAPVAENMPVIYAPGNLDFYSRKPMEQLLREATELADQIGNIHVLYNRAVSIGDARFLGTTLWTRIAEDKAEAVLLYSNDFQQICTSKGPWSVAQQNLEHDLAVDFLESELIANSDVTTVVVTHNIPHLSVNDPKYNDPRYRDQNMNPIFVADMKWLTDSPFAPDYWIAGTNIFTGEAALGKTSVMSNGLGHPRKNAEGKVEFENPEFDFDKTFDTHPKLRPTISFGM